MIRSPRSDPPPALRRRWRPGALGPALALALAVTMAGCGGEGEALEPAPPARAIPYDTLSEYGFFEGPLAAQAPRAGVFPYQVAAPLWADQAGKGRFFVPPAGEAAAVGAFEDWQFPIGTIVIKTFFFALDRREPAGAARIVETRLLVLGDFGWTPHTYVWNEEQTEATRAIAGRRVAIAFVDGAGAPAQTEYLVPNTNQCVNCHGRDDETVLLGLVTPQLNRDVEVDGAPRNQLAWLEERGALRAPTPAPEELPALPDPAGDAPLDARARAYLHGNCAHCHRPGGGAGLTGLVLLEWERDPTRNGVCKQPVAAGNGTGGLGYDIVPGAPDQSIMPFRMSSTDPEIKMPELPNRVPDADGIALITAWIAAMEPVACGAAPPPAP